MDIHVCKIYGKQHFRECTSSKYSLYCVEHNTALNTTPVCTLCNDMELSFYTVYVHYVYIERLLLHGVTRIHFLGNGIFSFRISELLRDIRNHQFRTLVL
jgi:hypothetical protein